ncbi:MAG TPA: hypothetical protein VFX70_20715 [Mycobacteriales bacterium]|nr:hypothetical protein [Mycobacteriales bacterium]
MRPGLNPARLAALTRAAVHRCALDLSGRVVLTEAASGAYSVTPVLAALAGAEHVFAACRDTRHATVATVAEATGELAELVGVADRIDMVATGLPGSAGVADLAAGADIVTNSGHVRPVDAAVVSRMRPGSVVSLMYEAWELRPSDVDVTACRERGVLVAGTNERHPLVDVFSFLGVMAVKLLLDAGVAVYRSRIVVLCDNPFRGYLERGLVAVGARVRVCDGPSGLGAEPDGQPHDGPDAVLVALRPGAGPVLTGPALRTVAERMPGAVVAQFWGDVDRAAARSAGVPVWPVEPPAPGHMGVLPSDVGPEPVVRLQTGGLKVGELLTRRMPLGDVDRAYLQPV